MEGIKGTEKELTIKLSVEELSPQQIRLLKSVNSLLVQVISADDESEYFTSSAELVKKISEVIKVGHFAKTHPQMDYATQAVEYALDSASDDFTEGIKGSIDN